MYIFLRLGNLKVQNLFFLKDLRVKNGNKKDML